MVHDAVGVQNAELDAVHCKVPEPPIRVAMAVYVKVLDGKFVAGLLQVTRAWSSNPTDRMAEMEMSVGASGKSSGVIVDEGEVVEPTGFVTRTAIEYCVFGESPVQRAGDVETSQLPIAGLRSTTDELTGGPEFATVQATEMDLAPAN